MLTKFGTHANEPRKHQMVAAKLIPSITATNAVEITIALKNRVSGSCLTECIRLIVVP